MVFVKNLPRDIQISQIRSVFQKCGRVKDIRLPLDSRTKNSKGFCYVEYEKTVDSKKH